MITGRNTVGRRLTTTALALVFTVLLAGCGLHARADGKTGTTPEQKVDAALSSMTLEEKVCQLFIVSPEELTGYGTVTRAGEATRKALAEHPVGGIIYFAKNLKTPDQTRQMLTNTKAYAKERSGIPIFLSVDEEGGTVSRIAANSAFGLKKEPSMRSLAGSGKDSSAAITAAGVRIGTYLKDLGFNLDYAPVADVAVQGAAIGSRSFGTDPEAVSEAALSFAKGLAPQGVLPCYKHFPGFGRAPVNTDDAPVSLDVSKAELEKTDLVPFRRAAEENIPLIMVGNMAFPKITGSAAPACMSEEIVTGILREELSYSGIAVTDALNAKAITDAYTSSEAAVACIRAGMDMLLLPEDFEEAYEGVLAAVRDGRISTSRIDASVRRILTVKYIWLDR